jgi:polyisoprenoid-binding protein YceI
MAQIDSSTGAVKVFTFREGALSALGHDLQLRASQFHIELLADSVSARVDVSSLRVVCAMRGGVPDETALSDRDKGDIERTCARDVLAAQKNPEATFVSSEVRASEGGWKVRGTLTVHGQSREGTFDVERQGDRAVARIDLDVRSFGMKPYSAMLGTLRVQPHVLVIVDVPLPTQIAGDRIA